jgi:signal peptidase I
MGKVEKAAENSVHEHKDRAAEVANTFEWLITAFILAFVFRAFIMEAFRIPTGSMADTLRGAHFRLRCPQCGYAYEHGYVSPGSRMGDDSIPYGGSDLPATRCPSCGHCVPSGQRLPVANGDRILVLKCVYQFFEPKRWDVVVFKNPLEPSVNYIKRLIGRPGETVEIIDGDIYIDGQIACKPPKVQEELWMPVYDNDYRPIRPDELEFGYHNSNKWRQPFATGEAGWSVDEIRPTFFHLDCPADQIERMYYDTSIGNDFRATYAYDPAFEHPYMPYCSDLMVRFYVQPHTDQGRIGVLLSKYGRVYEGWIDLSGRMVIAKIENGAQVMLNEKSVARVPGDGRRWSLVRFANVDHQLILEFGKDKLTYDLGRSADSAGAIIPEKTPQAGIFGSGKLTLGHVAVFRDIHYTEARAGADDPGRAAKGNPFPLEKDEFFVLGDNSPNSQDGRLWNRPGIGNGGRLYREGVVPRDYLVGKALFVYWPSGFKPFDEFPFAAIPNVGKMRFIYGGSNKGN